MNRHRVIMLASHLERPFPLNRSFVAQAIEAPIDLLGRRWHDLRISVTDRCNFRCSYCMPKHQFDKDHTFLSRKSLLDFDQITRIAQASVRLGVRTLRLTGGEPLLRKDVEELVARLRAIDAGETARLDIAMTTNGSLIRRKAAALRAAGLDRLTLSLDALDDSVFRAMNDVDFGVAEVLSGLDSVVDAGFKDTKVNMVVRRGVNEQQIVPMARYLRDRYRGAVELRFIEYMDVGGSDRWRSDDVVPSVEVLARLREHFPLLAAEPTKTHATAARWRYADGFGHVGTISSVSEPFCEDCSRARLSPEGRLYTCLFAAEGGFDLRPLLSSGEHSSLTGTQDRLQAGLRAIWESRSDRYSQMRHRISSHPPERIKMHYIGG